VRGGERARNGGPHGPAYCIASLLGGAIGTRWSAVKVRTADFVTPEYDAEIVTRVVEFTCLVETVNIAEVAPAGMVTAVGTVAVVELERSVIAAPPSGAGPLSVMVPCSVEPPTTDVGETDTAVSAEAVVAGSTVSVAVLLALP